MNTPKPKRVIKPIFKVIFILMSSIGIHTWYSSLSEPLNIGFELKQSKMSGYFTQYTPTDQVQEQKDHTRVEKGKEKIPGNLFDFVQQTRKLLEKKKKAEKVAKQRKGENILVAGDSMAGAAGLEYGFSPYIQFNNHTVHFVSFASSSTKTWSDEKKLSNFIEKYQPTYIIIALGSNELFVRDLDERDKYIKDILEQAGEIPLVWVGPPNWKKDTGINALIKKNLCDACYFDSQNLTLERQPDGIHPSMIGSTQWAEKLSEWLMNHCEYPIAMHKPTN